MDKQHITTATSMATTPAPSKKKRKRAGSDESGSTGSAQGRIPTKSPRPENEETGGAGHAVASNTGSVDVNKGSEKPSDRSQGSTPPTDHTPTVSQQNATPQQSQASSQSPQAKDPEAMRQSIEAQLSLEVLLKHDELRLIDQEIAKCQIALEQLRRCSEIPYPGSDAAGVLDTANVGTGRAVMPPGNGRPPQSPAPWGVRDGPYGRHYAKWLLPDPRFDGGTVPTSGESGAAPPATAGAVKAPADGRTTRGSVGDAGAANANQRPQRGSTGSNLQALSNGYPPPKDKTGPTIIKRKTDGHLVKLVCLDCRRDNFFSTQGFINHCRIAHNRNFASHDAAAIASGEEVEVDEAGMVIGENKEPGAAPGYIHPLIRSAHLVDAPKKESLPRRKSSKRSSQADSSQSTPLSGTQSETKPPAPRNDSAIGATPKDSNSPQPNPAFKASPVTPHLSALMQRRGYGLDLDNIVGDAKTKSELDMVESPTADDGYSEDEPEESNALANGMHRGGRQPARTVASAPMERPNSRKGPDNSGRKPRYLESLVARGPPKEYTSPYAPNPAPAQPDHVADVTSENLSPNTVESNQAPSLVSDDGDYEVASESEGPSPNSSDGEADDRRFDNIEVEDDEDRRGGPAAADAKGAKGDFVTRRSGVPLRYPKE